MNWGSTGPVHICIMRSWKHTKIKVEIMQYIIPDKVYDILKWVGLVALPAIATFVGTVGTACGWEFTGITVTVITAAGTLVGTLLGVSHATAKEVVDDD